MNGQPGAKSSDAGWTSRLHPSLTQLPGIDADNADKPLAVREVYAGRHQHRVELTGRDRREEIVGERKSVEPDSVARGKETSERLHGHLTSWNAIIQEQRALVLPVFCCLGQQHVLHPFGGLATHRRSRRDQDGPMVLRPRLTTGLPFSRMKEPFESFSQSPGAWAYPWQRAFSFRSQTDRSGFNGCQQKADFFFKFVFVGREVRKE